MRKRRASACAPGPSAPIARAIREFLLAHPRGDPQAASRQFLAPLQRKPELLPIGHAGLIQIRDHQAEVLETEVTGSHGPGL